MKKKAYVALLVAVSGVSLVSYGQTVQTPEQMAGGGPGLIYNQSFIEAYFGQINIGQNDTENTTPEMEGSQSSLVWYKYVSDGTTPVIFDMFGSNMSYGGGFTLGASNDSEIAVYASNGTLVADNKGGAVPATGDSNVVATVPSGAPPEPIHDANHQPLDPTQSSAYYETSIYGNQWVNDNEQGLAQIAFVKNPQSNPDPADITNWNQYPVLAAGTYFVAIAGYSTHFSGDPNDASDITADSSEFPYQGTVQNPTYVTPTTPFGFIDFSAFSGTTQLNVRMAGDFNGDSTVNSTDLALLRNEIATYLPNGGIPNNVSGWTPSEGLNGLPDNIRQFDLTGNTRIDKNDLLAWGDYTGLSTSLSITWNNTGGWGDGATWDVYTNENFTNSTGLDLFYNGDTVTFNDTNNGHYAVTLNSAVSPAAVFVNSSLGNYVISGTGNIAGTGSLTKSGNSKLTLNTVNTYSGGTNVSAGTLVVGVNGALPSGAVSITGGTLQLGASTGLAQITSLSIIGNGSLDIENNHVIINYGSGPDPIASIAALISKGYNGGAWNGVGGIVTSAPLVVGGLTYGIGYADAADSQDVATGLASGTIEVKYTLLGDADLNGIVNGIDFGILAANFNKGITGWDEGDFDYNNIVNGLDFGDLAANFNKGAAGTDAVAALDAFAAANGLLADVPEPASAALFVLSTIATLSRRSRRTS